MSSIPIPSDLINQIQSTLRSKSKIYPSSNPALPSLNDLIAAFDSDDDPSHLRCPNCLRSGGFIRGDQSTLCIFCGRDRGKDGITHSMSFKSTLACKNLLQYLQLDGSETINFETKSNDSDKGRETQQSHMVLSSLLDLELKWPSEKEEVVNENPVKDEVSVPAVNLSGAEVSVPAVNLSGADFDNFFTDSMNRTIGASTAPIVINEKSLPLKQSVNKENQEASRNDDTSLFNAIQTSNVAVSAIDIEGNQDGFDSFADWDASFESANSGTGHSESNLDDQNTMFSKAVGFFEGSTASFAVSETSIKEPVNSQGNINNTGKNEGSTDEWGIFSDDMVQNNQMAVSASDFKSTDLTTENDSWGEGEAWTTASNTKGKIDDIGDSLADGEIWATTSNSESQHDDIGDKNQSTDDWGDFSSVTDSNIVRNDVGTNIIDSFRSTSKTNGSDIWGHNELWASMSNTNDNDDMGNNTGVISPADSWGNFPSVTSSNNMVQNDVVTNTTDHLQSTSKTNDCDFLANNELWASMSNTKRKSDDNDDGSDNIGAISLADDWGNFSSSDKTIENKLLNTKYDIRSAIKTTENVSWEQDEIWAIPTTKTEHDNNVETDNHEEPTDDWGDFFHSDIVLQDDSSNKILQLDGSETLKFDTKSNDSVKGQETKHSHVVFPSLLDLEQKRPSEKEVVNGNLVKDEPSVPAVNLSGVDIDMFFTDSMSRTTGSSATAPTAFSEKSLPFKQSVTTENQEALRNDDAFLFNAIQTSYVAASSSNIKGSQDGFDTFVDWDASFQSTNSGTSHSESKPDNQNAMFSKSVDLIEGSTARLAISETSVKEPVNYSQGKINNAGNIEANTDEWGIFCNNIVQKNVLVDSDSSNIQSTNLKDENDSWGEGEEIWATASNNTKVKCDDIDDSWCEGEIWATASNSKGQHDDIGDKNQPTDDWGDFSFVTGSNNIVQNEVVINNTTDHLQSTSKTNDIDILGDNELWSSMFTATKSKSNDNGDMGNNNIGIISSADNLDNFSFVTGSNNMVQNEGVTNTTDHLQSTSKTNDIDIWGDNEPWSSMFTATKGKSNDNGDIGNNNIGVISSADNLGNISSVSGSNNMVQKEVLTNTTDHLQSTSKTNDSVIWGHDELWVSMSSNTKGKSDGNDDMGNSIIGVTSPSEDDWGNFSSSHKMIENNLSSTGNDTRSTIKTNENVGWDQDEIWATISANKSERNNNDEIDNHGEPADDDWGSYESAT